MKCPICNDTLVASSLSNGCVAHERQTNCPFVWQDITPGQLHALKDAALGRAVRRIPDMAKLWHAESRWYLHPGDAPCLPLGTGNSLEAALKAAGLMEGEEK